MSILSEQLRQKYDGHSILILGWGREGQATYQLLSSACPGAQLFVSDQNQEALTAWQTEHGSTLHVMPYLQSLSQLSVIFKSPGIPHHEPGLREYVAAGGKITSQLNEFLQAYRSQTIGVTGTKGKSTTSSLIATLYAAAGRHTLLAGNIGTPVFEIVDNITPDTQLVVEMSSYQLDSVKVSPHIAVMLNFFSEHLNYHQSIGNYLNAKAKITQYQTAEDVLIFNQDAPELVEISQQTQAQLLPFSYTQQLHYSEFIRQTISQLETIELPATIKKWNILPALLAAQSLNLSVDQTLTALKSFKPLPHRLENVGGYGGITWIDDTLATIPEATLAALDALPRVDVLMLGGYDRGISYQKVVEGVMAKKIPAVVFFKPSGQVMYELIRRDYPESSWPKMELVDTMEQAVRFGYQHAPEGGVVLLSPSSPSFGQFKNYEDKSAQFKTWITQLAPQPNSTASL